MGIGFFIEFYKKYIYNKSDGAIDSEYLKDIEGQNLGNKLGNKGKVGQCYFFKDKEESI